MITDKNMPSAFRLKAYFLSITPRPELSGLRASPVRGYFECDRTEAEESIFQFAIIRGLYARLETLYIHKTAARFFQGLTDLYH